jgi:NDP-sugar pyrophosphorylase family protein
VRRIGIVPAAGHARRLQPLAGSKELLPVRGRPVIDHLIDRMQAAACHEIRIVTRPAKGDVRSHAEARGAVVVAGEPATVPASLELGLAGLDPDDQILFGFPDTLWGPADGFVQLAERLERHEVVLGVFRSAEPERGDVVTLEGDAVTRIETKPAEPEGNLVWGCLAARAGALAGVGAHPEVSDHLRSLDLSAVVFDSDFVDIGTPRALAEVGS